MEEGRKKKAKKKGRPYLPIMESLICASPRVMRRPCACAGLSPSRTLPTLLRPGEICEREGSSEFLFVHIQAAYGKTDSAQRADHANLDMYVAAANVAWEAQAADSPIGSIVANVSSKCFFFFPTLIVFTLWLFLWWYVRAGTCRR